MVDISVYNDYVYMYVVQLEGAFFMDGAYSDIHNWVLSM